jgi:hypothetical protein
MWAAQALKFGYRWIAGNGRKIRFWEDCWFGTSPLSIQFWEIYCVCNETCQTISEVWDGHDLKLTFRRNLSNELMEQWYALESIAQGIALTSNMDSLI